ncbi:MAG: hypothetical protein ACAH59_10865, partial [Pseudobdellovibrionaceae bacterium]
TQSAKYIKVDSIWASLILNWGLIACAAYFMIFLIRPLKQILNSSLQTSSQIYSLLIFLFFWFFGIFNVSIYKHPLNVLFYLCLAYLLSTSRQAD